MLTAGLRNENQPSLWVSDHDEALETFERREQFARLTSYQTIELTHWSKPADMEFVTTNSADAPSWAEDATAIPDLLAGAYCKLSSVLPSHCGTELWRRVVPAGTAQDRRALVVGNWMATTKGRLRQILLRLELGSDGMPHASAQFFAGAAA